MATEESIQQLEEEAAALVPVIAVAGRLLAELTKPASGPLDELDAARSALRSARDLAKHGDAAGADALVERAGRELASARHWLAVADLGISPFLLRNALDREPLSRETLLTLLHYFLDKQPHAENDRDKVDLLATRLFTDDAAGQPLWPRREELRRALDAALGARAAGEENITQEVTAHELESLVSRLEEFTEFNQLVEARVVERARALKTNLGDAFYHPHVLAAVVRFNAAYRGRFEHLIQEQLATVRREARERIARAWDLVRTIEETYEELAVPETERSGTVVIAAIPRSAEARVGRPLPKLDERPPLDRLIRRGDPSPKENELRGIIARMARFLERLPAGQARAEKVTFPLRNAEMELARWERQAFTSSASSPLTESARTIQYALGVVAWVGEELSQYEQTRADRYLWKAHFDSLSYAVVRTVELLEAIRGLLNEDATASETEWFGPLLHTALRLTRTLNRVQPVFEEPAA
jgi:hypothetical protein